MRLVQFVLPQLGRRVGVVRDQVVIDLTSTLPECRSVYDLFQRSVSLNQRLAATIAELLDRDISSQYPYEQLLAGVPGGDGPYLLAPLDHPEPSRLMISGTGLSHLGSVQSRDQMHGGTQSEVPQTDSARMFEMGLKGGRPEQDQRGTAPEWFYKGDGFNLRGPQATLEIPAFALDGGEEPEIVGCYIIDPQGQPRRLGFVLGNEWSDHATETINYLYLAPSKLRMCSVGPSLQVTDEFSDIPLRCTVSRNGKTIYDSGELRSGESHMCHSLRNMEDHHFKYPEHRRPGDMHMHFFGTSRLSFSSRDWKYQAGDVIRIEAPGFCEPLVNVVAAGSSEAPTPFMVESA